MHTALDGRVKIQVVVDAAVEELIIDGFYTSYAAYRDLHEGEGIYLGGLLIVAGGVLVAIGVVTLIFGPETVYYNRMTGPSWLQFIQMYPGPLATAGFLGLGLGREIYAKAARPADRYLQEFYQLIDLQGTDISDQLALQHLENDKFRVVSHQRAT